MTVAEVLELAAEIVADRDTLPPAMAEAKVRRMLFADLLILVPAQTAIEVQQ